MVTDITQRDKVWAAIIEQRGSFTIDGVERSIHHRELPAGAEPEEPSRETVRRTLAAAAALGCVRHTEGSPVYGATWGHRDGVAAPPIPSTGESEAVGVIGDGEPIKCEHCDYQWVTESETERPTCPSCSRKTDRLEWQPEES